MSTDDFAFRPVDVSAGADGAIYVADFCEEFIAHGQHFQGQIDPATGAFIAFAPHVLRITPNYRPSTWRSCQLVSLWISFIAVIAGSVARP